MLERDEREALAGRALTRYLRGQRIPAIAEELAVSESTARRWIREALTAQADDTRAERAELLERAIESQRAIASAAWESYERERALDEALLRGDLDHVRRRRLRGARRGPAADTAQLAADMEAGGENSCPPLAEEQYERPKRSPQGARYLGLALAAQREVARLQGLYARLESTAPSVEITIIERPAGAENAPPALPALPTPPAAPEKPDGEQPT